jgi:hypothetical protein
VAARHAFRLWRVSFFGNNLVAHVSPVASFFLLLRQKKETKEKATPDRSKARKFVSILRQLRKLAIC